LSLGLSLLAAASTNAAPSPVRSPHERAPSSQARGVRTYGPGATRIDRAEPPRIERSPFGSVARSVEPAIAATRKISGVPMVGSVRSFAVSPNGTYAIYIADQEVLARTELYSVRVDGTTAPIKLSAGLPFGAGDLGVSEFQISADSARVVFRADANAGNGSDDLFSAPIDGSSAAVQLNLATQRPVTAFGLAPSSAWALFLGPDTAFGGGGSELYAASIATAVSAKQISDARRTIAAGGVVFADFSPDSVRAIYSADAVTDGVYQWFSVPLAAAAPGSDVQLSLALGTVALAAITPNGAQVVYTADERVLGQTEIFSIPIAGGTKLRLDATMAGDGVVALSMSPDGTRVAYLADQTTAGVIEVYGAQVGVASSAVRLNTPLAGTQVADNVNAGPDSATVLYEADQSVPGTVELYRVAFTGGTPTVLHSLVVPYDAGYFQDRGTPVFGRRAVYPVFGTAADLYSVPFDGSGAFLKLNDPLVSGQSVQSAFLPAQGARLMAFGVGATGSAVTPRIFAVPIRRDLAPESLNPAVGTLGVLDYAIAAGEKRAVYLQDQDTSGKPELYSRDLDSDADTVINVADNCPFVANLAQGAVVFGQSVLATTKTRFDWSTAADVRYVRGPLASLSTYVTNLSGTLSDAVSFTDATVPASGTGSYYLFAPDCTGRSYQSTLGKEPGRDAAAFP
jgi:hypothetical protein